MHSNLIKTVESLYSIHVEKVVEFERQHKDPVVNMILDCASAGRFFLKQIQPHSFRPELEDIYSRLSVLKIEDYRLVLPLANKHGQYVFVQDSTPFVLMHFEDITPFSKEKIECKKILALLSDFHERVKDFAIQRQSYRTLEGWLRRGPEQIRKRFGNSLPFVNIVEDFLQNRFPRFRFQEGVIHWDIHNHNFGVDPSGKLLLLDFDLLQPGPLACDLMRLAPMFRELNAKEIRVSDDVMMMLLSELKKVVSVDSEQADAGCFGLRDLKVLVGRCLIMEVWEWPDVDARLGEVERFFQEIENWVMQG